MQKFWAAPLVSFVAHLILFSANKIHAHGQQLSVRNEAKVDASDEGKQLEESNC